MELIIAIFFIFLMLGLIAHAAFKIAITLEKISESLSKTNNNGTTNN